MLLTRVIFLSIIGSSLAAFVAILTIGHDFRKSGPLKNGLRKRIIHTYYRFAGSSYIAVCGISSSTKTHDEIKYTKYLGPNYSRNEYASTIVSNHVSWLDPMVMLKEHLPAFSPTSGLKDLPMITTILDGVDSIYIPRGGSEQNKLDALNEIKKR